MMMNVNLTEQFGDFMNNSFLESDFANVTPTYLPYEERPETYIVPILFALITISGALGNGSLIFFFCKYPSMRRIPNIYILSLALGDLLVVVFAVPFQSIIYTLPSYPFPELICKMQNSMHILSLCVTVLTLTALSADRYLVIVFPVNIRAVSNTKRTICCVVIIWIIAIIVAIPEAIFSHLAPMDTSVYCSPFTSQIKDYHKVRTILLFLFFFLIPLVIIFVFYSLMAKELLHSSDEIYGEAHWYGNRRRQLDQRRNAAKMALIIVGVFFICFLPINIYNMWFFFHPTAQENYNYFWHSFRILGFCLSYINSCINPIALYCISGNFRNCYNRHVFCCCTTPSNAYEPSIRHLSSLRNANTVPLRTEEFAMSTYQMAEKTAV